MELKRTERSDGVLVLAVCEPRLDLSNASEFKRSFQAALSGTRRVVLDMARVEFVDSSGLGALLACLRDLASAGGALCLCSVQRRVLVMFELVRLHRIVPIAGEVAEAVVLLEQGDAA